MSKSVLGFSLIALCLGALGLFFFLEQNKGSHLVLNGSIKKVRIQELEPKRSLMILDFRLTNPSDFTFEVKNIDLYLTTSDGEVVEGAFAAQMNTDQIFESYNTLGQRYNPTLVSREKIPPGKIVDRMVAVSVNLPAAAVESRKKLVLKIEEMNRMITELVELPK